jgi:hypothetical protein
VDRISQDNEINSVSRAPRIWHKIMAQNLHLEARDNAVTISQPALYRSHIPDVCVEGHVGGVDDEVGG